MGETLDCILMPLVVDTSIVPVVAMDTLASLVIVTGVVLKASVVDACVAVACIFLDPDGVCKYASPNIPVDPLIAPVVFMRLDEDSVD